MKESDNRKHPRVSIYSPISYSCNNSEGEFVEHSIAVVRNVSQSGIQIESIIKIGSKEVSLIFLDYKKNEIKIKGEIIYCEKNESDLYIVGIKLLGSPQKKSFVCEVFGTILPLPKRKISIKNFPSLINCI